jgi:hypothetical protein
MEATAAWHGKRQQRSSVGARRRTAAHVGARRRCAVLLFGDVPPPCDRAAGPAVLLHRDADHGPVRGCAVPVVLPGPIPLRPERGSRPSTSGDVDNSAPAANATPRAPPPPRHRAACARPAAHGRGRRPSKSTRLNVQPDVSVADDLLSIMVGDLRMCRQRVVQLGHAELAARQPVGRGGRQRRWRRQAAFGGADRRPGSSGPGRSRHARWREGATEAGEYPPCLRGARLMSLIQARSSRRIV